MDDREFRRLKRLANKPVADEKRRLHRIENKERDTAIRAERKEDTAAARREKTRKNLLEKTVVMWDGEGLTRTDSNGIIRHDYVMLRNSNGALLFNAGKHLTTLEIFNFLIEQSDAKALNVGYGIGYDVTMILKSISDAKTITLLNGKKCSGWAFIKSMQNADPKKPLYFIMGEHVWSCSYRSRKQFKVKRAADRGPDGQWIWHEQFVKTASGKKKKVGKAPSFSLWDIVGYYQMPFVQALKDNNITCDLEETAEMKGKRGSFTDSDIPRIMEYCVNECIDGAKMFKETVKQFVDADIIPTRFDGPGALAAALYMSEGVKQFITDEPEDATEAVNGAYFGGHIETFKLGTIATGQAKQCATDCPCRTNANGVRQDVIGGIYGYDISSAYPAQIQHLPDLRGTWELVQGAPTTPLPEGCWRLIHLKYRLFHQADKNKMGESFYPLPYRTDTNTVLFSNEGENWHWHPEYEASLVWSERFNQPQAEIIEYWEYRPHEPSLRPFTFVLELYNKRQELKANGIAAEKTYKLTLNSLYGKMAQQLGASLEQDADGNSFVKKPPFFSMAWAGMITAGARAELILASCACPCPKGMIMVMTDGIYSLVPLNIPTAKKVLGAWEPPEYYDEFVVAQAGVYWYHKPVYTALDKKTLKPKPCTMDKATKKALFDDESPYVMGGGWTAKQRGFDRDSMLTPKLVKDAWNVGKREIEVPVTRFYNYGMALMGKAGSDTWAKRCTWTTSSEKRVLLLDAKCPKRKAVYDTTGLDFSHVDLGVQHNLDYTSKVGLGQGEYSMPYKSRIPTLEEMLDEAKEEDDWS